MVLGKVYAVPNYVWILVTNSVKGIQQTTAGIRVFHGLFQQAGHTGTLGQGCNRMNNIHVKDAANAILLIIKAALNGKADEGADGLCKSPLVGIDPSSGQAFEPFIDFVVSEEPRVTMRELMTKMGEVCYFIL